MYVFVCYGGAMEAAVAEREAGMTEWTDGRLNELSKKVDDGFAKVDHRFEQVEEKMTAGFTQVNSDMRELSGRFDKLQHSLMQVAFALGIGALAMIAALLGVIVKLL